MAESNVRSKSQRRKLGSVPPLDRLHGWRPRVFQRRWAAAVVVFGLHLLAVELLMANRVAVGVRASDSVVAVYFVTRPAAALRVLPPEVSRRRARRPRPAQIDIPVVEVSHEPPGVMGLTIPAGVHGHGVTSPDPSIVEAEPENIYALRALCDAAYPAESRQQEEQGAISLLIRVEPDGRVSLTKLETSSGVPRLDEAAANCLAQGRFAPEMPVDQPIASWQRTHWVFSLVN
jgi:TonB family protein